MSVRKTLPTAHVSFPPGCVRCGSPADGERMVTATRGVDLLFVSWNLEAEIPVPTCRRCRRKRAVVGILSIPVFVLIFCGLLLGVRELADAGIVDSSVVMCLFAVPAIALLYYSRNCASPLMDRLFLRVCGVTVTKNPPTVTLQFADPAYADEVERLTEAQRAETLHTAREYLASAENRGRGEVPDS